MSWPIFLERPFPTSAGLPAIWAPSPATLVRQCCSPSTPGNWFAFLPLVRKCLPFCIPCFKEGSHRSSAQTLRVICNHFHLRCLHIILMALKSAPRRTAVQPLGGVAESIALQFAVYAEETFSRTLAVHLWNVSSAASPSYRLSLLSVTEVPICVLMVFPLRVLLEHTQTDS